MYRRAIHRLCFLLENQQQQPWLLIRCRLYLKTVFLRVSRKGETRVTRVKPVPGTGRSSSDGAGSVFWSWNPCVVSRWPRTRCGTKFLAIRLSNLRIVDKYRIESLRNREVLSYLLTSPYFPVTNSFLCRRVVLPNFSCYTKITCSRKSRDVEIISFSAWLIFKLTIHLAISRNGKIFAFYMKKKKIWQVFYKQIILKNVYNNYW